MEHFMAQNVFYFAVMIAEDVDFAAPRVVNSVDRWKTEVKP
jgi:hypothetical protein